MPPLGDTWQMLTGDSLLTATHAASTLSLSTKPPLLLHLLDPPSATSATSAATAAATATAAPAAAKSSPSPIERYLSSRGPHPSPTADALLSRLIWKPWRAEEEPTSAPPRMRTLSRSAFRDLARTYDLCMRQTASNPTTSP